MCSVGVLLKFDVCLYPCLNSVSIVNTAMAMKESLLNAIIIYTCQKDHLVQSVFPHTGVKMEIMAYRVIKRQPITELLFGFYANSKLNPLKDHMQCLTTMYGISKCVFCLFHVNTRCSLYAISKS